MSTKSGDGKLVLIVDDMPDSCFLLEVILKSKGYQTMTASNGIEALECMSERLPDLIISDILMPNMDGFVFCKKCKTNPALAKIPFVFYTATYTSAKDEEFALSLGADLFIKKPMEIEQFSKNIEDVLNKYKTGILTPTVPKAPPDEQTFMKEYNQALICKLEDKITELETAKNLAQQKENLLRAILNSSPDIVLTINEDGIFLDAMTRDKGMLYKTPEEFIGRHFNEVMPKDLNIDIAKLIELAITSGNVQTIQYQLPVYSAPMWLEAKITLVKDYFVEGKKVVAIVIRDITPHKALENELKLLNQNLAERIEDEIKRRQKQEKLYMQQARFSAMSDMLISISHHWRQPLNAIGLLFQHIKDEFDNGTLTADKLTYSVNLAMSKLTEMSNIITQFIKLIKPSYEKSAFELKKATLDVISLLKPQLEQSNIDCKLYCKLHNQLITSKTDLCCDDMFVYAEEQCFNDCLVRLISNAEHAITKATKDGTLTDKGLITISFDKKDKRLIVSVEDNGCKIAENIIDRIFEPYFTSYDDVKTQGIGLYIAKMTVENSLCGKINAYNTDTGACFRIELDAN